VKVEVSEHGADQATTELIRLGRRAIDARPALERAQELLAIGEKTRVLPKARASMRPHKATLERKKRAGYPPIPLYQTGKLQSSLTRAHDPMGIRTFLGSDRLLFGTRVHYARWLKPDLVDVPLRTSASIKVMTLRYLLTGRTG
jgi:hypothetical protein